MNRLIEEAAQLRSDAVKSVADWDGLRKLLLLPPNTFSNWKNPERGIPKDKLVDLFGLVSPAIDIHYIYTGERLDKLAAGVMPSVAAMDHVLFGHLTALSAGLQALIRAIPFEPNLPTVLRDELERAKQSIQSDEIDSAAVEAFDEQAGLVLDTVYTHHSRR